MTMMNPISGRDGGRFLARQRIRKPEECQPKDPSLDRAYYEAQDLYVGALVRFNRHTFLLTAADEYALQFMEREENREKVETTHLPRGEEKVAL